MTRTLKTYTATDTLGRVFNDVALLREAGVTTTLRLEESTAGEWCLALVPEEARVVEVTMTSELPPVDRRIVDRIPVVTTDYFAIAADGARRMANGGR